MATKKKWTRNQNLLLLALIIPLLGLVLHVYQSQHNLEPNIKVVDLSILNSSNLENPEKILGSETPSFILEQNKTRPNLSGGAPSTPNEVTSQLDIDNVGIDHYFLDFKLKNSGDGVAVIKSVDIKVTSSIVDYTPILSYVRFIEPNKITVLIDNRGWGPAKNVEFKDFQNDDSTRLISILGLNKNNLIWHGNIPARSKSRIAFLFEKKFKIGYMSYFSKEGQNILKNSAYHGSLYGSIEYYDIYGKYHNENYIAYETIIIKNDNLYIVDYGTSAGAEMPPSAIYYTSLRSESKTPYTVRVPVSHELQPNTADRFLIKLDTDKTATYELIAYVNYDTDKVEETAPLKVKIHKY